MPALLPLPRFLPIPGLILPLRLPSAIKHTLFRAYSVMGLHVSRSAASTPCRVGVVLVRFRVQPGRGEEVGQVGVWGSVGGGAAGAVLGVDQEEGEEEGGEVDGGED